MSSKSFLTVINYEGEEKTYPISSDEELHKVRFWLHSTDLFLQGIINREYKEGLMSQEEYVNKKYFFWYTNSIFTRIEILCLLESDFDSIFCKVAKDNVENEGFTIPRANSLRMISLYQQYLDNIYNIMENISRFNLFCLNKNMAHSFFDQRKKIIEGKYPVPSEYLDIIRDEMDWYEDVHLIRSNMNHFLIGDYDIEKTENGRWIFKYQNTNLSHRALLGNKQYIERNIVEDIKSFKTSLFSVLKKIFNVYLKKVGTDKKAHILKYTADGINIHELSFSEFISGEKGKIVEKIE
jgi:hypothetical protein